MDEIFDKIQAGLGQQRPFAVYAKPGSNMLCGIFQKDNVVHSFEGYGQSGFVFAPFAEGKTCFIPLAKAEVLTVPLNVPPFTANAAAPEADPAAKAAFEALVAKGVDAIKAGEFDKVVLSRTEAVPVGGLAVTEIFCRMLAAYPMAMRYCFFHPDAGLWLGATPEQLLKAGGNRIRTVALAGTQVYNEGQEAQWPEKERGEQQFVTDFILHELSALAETIGATTPYTYRAGNIVHIKTDIEARLKESAALGDVVQKLHPTPAVCGLPKAPARDFIIASEGYDRSYYSGFLGELNFEVATGNRAASDLFVNLRCMKMAGDTAHLFIGCGVTAGSDPEKEFIETVNKSMTLRRVLVPNE